MRILSTTEKASRIELRVRNSRLRLAQRLLIAEAEADPELKIDPQWTRCLASATTLCVQSQKELSDQLEMKFKPEGQNHGAT